MAREGYPIDPNPEFGSGEYDFTDPMYQDPLQYRGYPTRSEQEAKQQRQRWQARLLRENPDDMELFANQERVRLQEEAGGDATDWQTQSPAERDAELERLLDEYFR